jgi:hypothetical protein
MEYQTRRKIMEEEEEEEAIINTDKTESENDGGISVCAN